MLGNVWRWCRRRSTSTRLVMGGVLVVFGLGAPSCGEQPAGEPPAPEATSRHGAASAGRVDRIVEVTDGDTVVLERLGKTRLIGVDTPEVYGGVECYGREASAYAKRLLPPGTRVRYRFDVERRDPYGRSLVYLWADGEMVNAELVRGGYAVPLTIPPNVRHADGFRRLARQARRAERGLWARSACAGDVEQPASRQEPTPEAQGPSVDPSGDKDCDDFSSQAEAQAYFEAKGGPASDPDRLDADGDGSACDPS